MLLAHFGVIASKACIHTGVICSNKNSCIRSRWLTKCCVQQSANGLAQAQGQVFCDLTQQQSQRDQANEVLQHSNSIGAYTSTGGFICSAERHLQ
jgi:hypothetical protein